MSKRDEFITFIQTFRAASPTITNQQRIGFLRQAKQKYGLFLEEAEQILKDSGLVIGESVNYFEVLEISVEDIQSLTESAIAAQVDAKHDKLFRASLNAGARIRPDHKTEDQWREILNEAKAALIDPQKRQEHIAEIDSQKQQEHIPELERETASYVFTFTNGDQPDTPQHLARLIDGNWTEAKTLLYSGVIPRWLESIHQPRLVHTAKDITEQYRSRQDVGLEMLVQTLDPYIGEPEAQISLSRIDFDNIDPDTQETVDLEITNVGRGFLYGEVEFSKELLGLEISEREVLGGGVVSITLDTNQLTPNETFETTLVITTNGGTIRIPTSYRVMSNANTGSGLGRSSPAGMVLIPAGEFDMGSNASRYEQPVHKVYVDVFYMDATEVTNHQFKEFLLENPQWQKGRVNAQFAQADYLYFWNENNYPNSEANHPVTYVSWYAAMAYSEWAGKRLPTEAEWEKAARGGLVGKTYPWGNAAPEDDILPHANYDFLGDSTGKTTFPVGSFPPNGYGLYDMAGNVWEWCLDEYAFDFYSTFLCSVVRNPLSGAPSIEWALKNHTNNKLPRVLRGGSWENKAWSMRCATRYSTWPTRARGYIGFRCARSVTP